MGLALCCCLVARVGRELLDGSGVLSFDDSFAAARDLLAARSSLLFLPSTAGVDVAAATVCTSPFRPSFVFDNKLLPVFEAAFEAASTSFVTFGFFLGLSSTSSGDLRLLPVAGSLRGLFLRRPMTPAQFQLPQ